MEANELRELGRAIARDIATGLMAATAAGAAEFSREMKAAREEAETDGLLGLGERVEAEKRQLTAQIAGANGLKRLALQKRLRQVESAEAEMCRQIEGETLQIEHQPSPHTDPAVVAVPAHTRRKPSRNGVPVTNGHGEG